MGAESYGFKKKIPERSHRVVYLFLRFMGVKKAFLWSFFCAIEWEGLMNNMRTFSGNHRFVYHFSTFLRVKKAFVPVSLLVRSYRLKILGSNLRFAYHFLRFK